MSGHAALSVNGPDGWAIWITDDADLCVDPGACPSVTLDIGRHIEYVLLERVRAGAITEFSGQYFDDGKRISWHTVNLGFEALTETGYLQLIPPPDSGARSAEEYEPQLVKEVHLGLTVAERTRRVVLTERGLAKHRELCERAASG